MRLLTEGDEVHMGNPLPMEKREPLKNIERGLSSGVEKKYWKAAADLCEYIEDSPQAIWGMVVKYGSHKNPDLRSAIATCVLEHILEHHFEDYFPKVKKILLSKNKNFRDCFMSCWQFGKSLAPPNAAKWGKLVWLSASSKEKKSILYRRKREKLKAAAAKGSPKAVAAYQKFLSQ